MQLKARFFSFSVLLATFAIVIQGNAAALNDELLMQLKLTDIHTLNVFHQN